ncbi:hypothetical protein [Cryobacterium tagatosivorans]|uniref:PKD domain-containing protein n=1 Tax=Cryobacterium tagatosivorans TaxID=1259199 RepID=A0A4R8UGD6_9MICO|nr:hypothetical protein [Cryobacterium tagatosivorans]TFB51241.1 hypothetical protein E3O23_08775 [Cryobacterium tagatosivorans]
MALVLVVLASVVFDAPIAFACTLAQRVGSNCPEASGVFDHGGVDLSAGFDSNSGGGVGTPRGVNGTGPGGGQDGAQGSIDLADPMVIVRDGFTVNCVPRSPCDPSLVVSMSDLVNFQPVVPTQGMEPNGWIVVGLPTNFFAAASAHTRSGLLLGFPAEVRFTPAGYRWNYGDGATGGSTTGGARWADQNLPEFSETATSHTYLAAGDYVITLAVDYAAEYRFAGQPWKGIGGTLAVPANPITAPADTARTVLVARECTRNPSGPGC